MAMSLGKEWMDLNQFIKMREVHGAVTSSGSGAPILSENRELVGVHVGALKDHSNIAHDQLHCTIGEALAKKQHFFNNK